MYIFVIFNNYLKLNEYYKQRKHMWIFGFNLPLWLVFLIAIVIAFISWKIIKFAIKILIIIVIFLLILFALDFLNFFDIIQELIVNISVIPSIK